jgi:hypothetical protein
MSVFDRSMGLMVIHRLPYLEDYKRLVAALSIGLVRPPESSATRLRFRDFRRTHTQRIVP